MSIIQALVTTFVILTALTMISGIQDIPTACNQPTKCDEEGYHPNPKECSKFYRCVDKDGNSGKLTMLTFDCAEGMVFDPSIDTCNHPMAIESTLPCANCNLA